MPKAPPNDRRTRKRLERREEILRVAGQIVAAEGLAALTVVRLAAELDLALGGLYRYFSGRSALIAALEAQALATLAGALEAAGQARRPRSPLAGLWAQLLVYIRLHQSHPAEHRLIDELVSAPAAQLSDPEARAFEPELARVLGLVVQSLEACVAAGQLSAGDQEERAYRLWGVLHGLGHLRKRDRLVVPRLAAEKLAKATVWDLFTAWGASEQDLQALARSRG